ncbi:cadherin domain-containing protein [Pyruvatibacter mobilis]|uniref:cadherin domain-containing protein n=1 Tax=Pyruvatibacter mobilis TaxID=1712261 RepID=UPI003BA9B07B
MAEGQTPRGNETQGRPASQTPSTEDFRLDTARAAARDDNADRVRDYGQSEVLAGENDPANANTHTGTRLDGTPGVDTGLTGAPASQSPGLAPADASGQPAAPFGNRAADASGNTGFAGEAGQSAATPVPTLDDATLDTALESGISSLDALTDRIARLADALTDDATSSENSASEAASAATGAPAAPSRQSEVPEDDDNIVVSNEIINQAPTDILLDNAGVPENAAPGTVVAVLSAIDPDSGEVFSYEIVGGSEMFEIVGNAILVKPGAELDHEAQASVSLPLRVTDSAGNTYTETVTLEIFDVNEVATDIALDNASVAENDAGAVVGDLSTTDPDAGDTHTYTVSDNRFEVVDGQLKLKDGVSLDHEAADTISLDVTTTDAGGLSRTETFTISVGDENEVATDIALDNTSVAENAAGAVVGNLSTTDPDAGDTHTYAVSDDRFEVVDGQLKLKDGVSLDHEAADTISLDVTTTDAGGLSRTETFTISVGDENEIATDIALDNNSVAENAAGAVVGTLTTTDPDAGDTHTYAVSDDRFEVVDSQLKLKDGVSLDHEAADTISLDVTTTDAGGLSRTETFTISVGDENEVATDIALDNSSVDENAAGAVVGNFTTVDPDAGDTHTYAVSDDRFEVVDGQLKLKDGVSLDHEAADTISLDVTTTDAGGLSRTETFTISVGDENEVATDIALDNTSVAENAAGAVVGNLTTTDPDAGDSHTYAVSDDRFEVVDGQLKLKDGVSLDHEAADTISLDVTTTDAGGLSRTETFTISVGDENEVATDIALDNTSVAENAAGAVVGNLSTTDPDAGDTHTYAVSDDRFEVVDGQLKLKDGVSLDHEAADTISLDVTTTDAGGLSRTETFTISVGDENEIATDIALDNNSVAENAAGAVVGTLTTTDPDAGDTHTYAVSDDRFEVVDSQLKLKDGVSLDHEAADTISLDVTTTDAGGLSRTETFTISVGDENEVATDIALDNSSVDENAAGAVVGNFTTVDPDAGDTHTYAVSDDRFEVVDGQLKLKDGVSLDHEAADTISLDVTTTDAGGLSRTETFTISVGDENEVATDIALDNTSVAENAAGAVVGNLTTTDPDAGDSHTYAVSDDRFEVVDGQLKLKDGVSLDHEAADTISLDVTTTDAGGLSRTETFTISVSDENEVATDIALDNNSVTENAAGAVVGNLSTTDPDAGDSHSYTVSDNRFEVVDGQLKLKDGVSLDHEAADTISLDVTTTDAGGLSRTETFTISVGDENEVATDIALDNNSVAENAAGAVVGNLSTTDPDAGDTHTYAVSDDRFEVVDGQLKLKDGVSLDHEAADTISLDVTTTDAGGLSRTETFTIAVDDENEVATDIALDNNSVAENAAGAVVGTLTTTDPDAGDTHTYAVSDDRFEVVDGQLKLKDGVSLDHEAADTISLDVTTTDAGGLSRTETFTISVGDENEVATDIALDNSSVAENDVGAVVGTLTTTDPDAGDTHTYAVSDDRFEVVDGQLKLKDGVSLDQEETASIDIEVTSTDAGGLSRTETFTVAVTDTNEGPTDIALDNTSVAENAAGAVVGTLTTTDPDAGDTHTYAVSDDRFEVVDGQLKLKDGVSLDHEAADTISLDVTTTDAGGLSRTETFTISVGDENEVATDIALDNNSVAENAAGAVVGNLSTTDPDAGDSHTYAVSDDRFEVVDGQLKLKDGVSLDHEAADTISLDVTTTDAGGLSRTETFTISVDDENEVATDIALDNTSVAENDAGAVVGNLTTTDPDAGDTHTYAVSDDRFEVVDGQLKLKDGVSLDHEAADTISLDVTTTDAGGLSRTETFTISVGDENEVATDIALDNNSVAENAAGAVVGNLSTTDPDAGDSHTYAVSDDRFEVVDGQLKLKDGVSLDHEAADTISLDVTTTDAGGLSRTETFTISVGDENEVATDIALDNSSVAENDAGAVIGNLSTTDPDAGDTHTYAVSDDRFEVVDGQLKLKDGVSLDHEAADTISLDVTTTDAGGLSRTETFTISVSDENEVATDIALDNNSVAENAAGAVVGNLSTTDPDAGDTHTYAVSDDRFEVVDGQLKLKDGVSLDHEAADTISLDVTTTDAGGLSRTETFTIAVGDENEVATDIALDNTSVAENDAGAVVGTLTTTDPDAGDTHTYAVSDDRFEVVDGQLKLKDGVSLDHEAADTISLDVTTTDAGGLSRTETFTIAVDDVNETAVVGEVDLGATVEDNAVTFTQADLLANTNDDGYGDLTVQNVTVDASAGTIVDNGNGTWTFTPADDYSAADVNITFDVQDGPTTVQGTATIDVTADADAPSLSLSQGFTATYYSEDSHLGRLSTLIGTPLRLPARQ